MDIATFHASRRFADVKSGRIAYVRARRAGRRRCSCTACRSTAITGGTSSTACSTPRRCIAIDLMGLGYTEIAPGQDVSFTAQARMLAEVLDALGIDKVDLVGNDSGGAIAQIFAAHHPQRLTLAGADQLRRP